MTELIGDSQQLSARSIVHHWYFNVIDKEHVYDGFFELQFQSQSAQHIDECRPRGILRLPRSRNDGVQSTPCILYRPVRAVLSMTGSSRWAVRCANFTQIRHRVAGRRVKETYRLVRTLIDFLKFGPFFAIVIAYTVCSFLSLWTLNLKRSAMSVRSISLIFSLRTLDDEPADIASFGAIASMS